MELWIGRAKKTSTCHACDEPIAHGQALIQGRAKKRKGKPWPPVLRWHPECWYQSSLQYLETSKPDRVKVVKNLGRPKLEIDEESRKRRYLLVRQFNTLLFRRKQVENYLLLLDELDESKLETYAHLTAKLQACACEVKAHGGIPPSWEKIIGTEACA